MRRASLTFIFITLLIDVIGFGIVIPVLPDLVEGMSGSREGGSRAYGWLISAYGLMQFLFAPVLGKLSDRYGRRPVILLALLFTGLDYVLQALAPTVAWLFVGRIVAGIMGASFTAANAYIADISAPEDRAKSFGLVGAAFGAGFIVGPALGGILGDLGPRVPFWAAAAATGINLLYGWFVLPESLAPEHRRSFALTDVNPFRGLSILGRDTVVRTLAIAALLLYVAQGVPQAIWVLSNKVRFGWEEKENGFTLAILGACTMFVQLVLVRVLQPRLGDSGLARLGFVVNAIGFVGLGLAASPVFLVAAMAVWTVCFLGGPALQSLVSKRFGPDEQGAAGGAMASLWSLSSVVGPPIWTALFAVGSRQGGLLLGLPYFVGAAVTLVALAVSIRPLRQMATLP